MDQLKENSVQFTEICASCGKRRDDSPSGSLTSWLFRHNYCQCMLPSTVSPASEAVEILREPPALALGERYDVLGLIGQGGMGAVYKIFDRTKNEHVAVKVLRPEFVADRVAVGRFEQEARTAMGFNHPNLVTVFEYGVTAQNVHFLIMEYLEGRSLDILLQNTGALAPAEALPIFLQISNALAYIHSRQLVHRDLKPSNIIVTNNESGPLVKIVDFGIAKVLSESTSSDITQMTQTGELLGSPPYMSPEQCMGQVLDARSDIYSFGCMMYHTLDGRPPFEGENPVHIIVQQLNKTPQNFSSRGREVPGDLAYIVMRCLQKSPEDRYASAVELQEDLLKYQEGKRLSRRNTFGLQKRLLRRGLPAIASTVALLVLVGIGASKMIDSSRSSLPLETQWHNLDIKGQELFDHGQLEEAKKVFRDALQLADDAKDQKLILASYNELLDLARCKGEPVDELTKKIAGLKSSESSVSDLLAELDFAIASSKGIERNKTQISRIERLCNDAIDAGTSLSQSESGNSDAARALFTKAEQLALKSIGPKNVILCRCYHNIAQVEHDSGHYKEAIAGYEQAVMLSRVVREKNDPLLARTLAVLGRAYTQIGSYELAEKALDEAMKINSINFGPQSKEVAWCKYELANLFQETGDFSRAKNTVKAAITMFENVKDPEPSKLARCYALLGQLSGSFVSCKKALALYEEERDKNYVFLRQDLAFLAQFYGGADPAQSENYIKRGLALCDRFPAFDRDSARSELLQTLGFVRLQQNQTEEAQKSFNKALSLKEKCFGKESLSLVESLTGLATAHTDDPVKAEENYRRAISLLKRSKNPPKNFLREAQILFQRYSDWLKSRKRLSDACNLNLTWKQIYPEEYRK